MQCACVRWYRLQQRGAERTLFAVPNGGARNIATAARLKEEGVVAGVADLFLAAPNRHHHGFFIEMKTPTGRQSDTQKEFQKQVEARGYKYAICRTLHEFAEAVKEYLKDREDEP